MGQGFLFSSSQAVLSSVLGAVVFWNRQGVGVGIGLDTSGHQCQLPLTYPSQHAWESASPDN